MEEEPIAGQDRAVPCEGNKEGRDSVLELSSLKSKQGIRPYRVENSATS